MIARVLLSLSNKAREAKIKKLLTRNDVLVEVPKSGQEIWQRVNRETCELVVISVSMIPEPRDDMIRRFSELPDAPGLVLISDKNEPEERATLLAAGAEEVLFSGLSAVRLLGVLETILERRLELARQVLESSRPLARPRLADFVSNSPVMQDFIDLVRRIVPGSSSLLLLGETGVGKERLARAVHAEGPRSAGPFIAVNCGALPESLLESELFGHEEGAFTGATRSRRGFFEMAHQGTIFLDEVGEMPLHVQVRLLRVLQEQEVQRVGGERPVKVNVRVMAATNRDLADDVESGLFRRDLYYRLSVVTLTVPPLRERRADIADLVESYLDYLRPRVGREILSIREDALSAMEAYDWPGNVLELINVVERAMLLCSGDEIEMRDLPDLIRACSPDRALVNSRALYALESGRLPESWLEQPLVEVRETVVEALERAYIDGILTCVRGRIGEAAERCGITPRALYDKMKRYGLRKEEYKPLR